ncbi:MAG TPA: hypothetical protein VK095_16720 [Beutenbergiaceae bacterium]|nr:hypothetical protein [Beutenbergiaceae bacterium]
MSTSQNVPEDREAADAQAALSELTRAYGQVHARRWWYVAMALVMAISLSAFYVGILMSPDVVDRWIVPGAVIVVGVLTLLQWRARSLPESAKALENRVVWISLGLVVVLVLISLVLPDDLSPWFGAFGVLPAVPWAALAWRVSRR